MSFSFKVAPFHPGLICGHCSQRRRLETSHQGCCSAMSTCSLVWSQPKYVQGLILICALLLRGAHAYRLRGGRRKQWRSTPVVVRKGTVLIVPKVYLGVDSCLRAIVSDELVQREEDAATHSTAPTITLNRAHCGKSWECRWRIVFDEWVRRRPDVSCTGMEQKGRGLGLFNAPQVREHCLLDQNGFC